MGQRRPDTAGKCNCRRGAPTISYGAKGNRTPCQYILLRQSKATISANHRERGHDIGEYLRGPGSNDAFSWPRYPLTAMFFICYPALERVAGLSLSPVLSTGNRTGNSPSRSDDGAGPDNNPSPCRPSILDIAAMQIELSASGHWTLIELSRDTAKSWRLMENKSLIARFRPGLKRPNEITPSFIAREPLAYPFVSNTGITIRNKLINNVLFIVS
jgi:hypothetical protein